MVVIFKNKSDGTYSFVNLTKEHICSCKFKTIEEAIQDMNDRLRKGLIESYVVKGEMKLVGVRPLSPHYMSLYSEEVRSLRTQFTPGLLPPFYADLPGTLDEIQQSELRYLQACMTKGILITDIHYFFKIIRNLLFNHAKSA